MLTIAQLRDTAKSLRLSGESLRIGARGVIGTGLVMIGRRKSYNDARTALEKAGYRCVGSLWFPNPE